jgi:hypothetical protein
MPIRLSYANVMATVAVFIALGGGAYAALSLPAGSVNSKQIAKNAVRAKQIAKRAVRKKELARNAVRSRKIKDGRVKSFDLAEASVTSAKLADDSVSSPKLAGGAVTTPKLADGAVITRKLADESVTPPKLGTVDFARVEAAGSTSSGAATDLSPAGPELELTLGGNVFATVLAQATMTAPGGATTEDCRFGVVVTGPGFEVQLPFEGGATFSGAPSGPRTEYALTLPPLPGGDMSFRMVYRRASGDEPCTFSNRRLWVEVAEP